MKQKIGMIPLLYNEYNYGGVLQFYALQQAVTKLGYDIDILVLPDDGLVCHHQITGMKKILIGLMKPIYLLKNNKKKRTINNLLNNRFNKIDKFKEMNYTCLVEDINFKSYKAVICGSDQIWNPKWAKKRTMLVNVPDEVNKVIYAASMGCDSMTEYEKNEFKPLINRIQHISVREFSAKKLLDDFVDRDDIKVVLDPTLLLKPSEWDKVNDKPEYDNYIFTYFLGDSTEYQKTVFQMAKDTHSIIINIPFASGERMDTSNFGDVNIIDASPSEFIGLIAHANVVFTDSFHACVFSILYEKQYYVFERNGSTKMLGRILTLQKHFCIDSRIIKAGEIINNDTIIDYSKNDYYQDRLINYSLDYLINAINDK